MAPHPVLRSQRLNFVDGVAVTHNIQRLNLEEMVAAALAPQPVGRSQLPIVMSYWMLSGAAHVQQLKMKVRIQVMIQIAEMRVMMLMGDEYEWHLQKRDIQHSIG